MSADGSSPRPLFVVANARMPSERAQSLQVAQVAGSFARAGVTTTLLHARRHPTPDLPAGQDLFDYYAVPPGPRPTVEAIDNLDWIDRVPRALQFVPARIQELSFGRNAARRIEREGGRPLVLSREVETALRLVRRTNASVFLEVHRVPGGTRRRRWLLEAAEGLRGVVAISGGVRDDLVELGLARDAIVVEHDAVEASRFAELPSREGARERLGLAQDASVVVYTGGLLAWKGVDLLVEAARALPELHFVIAGGMTADVARLAERARGLRNVRIDGFQPPERVVDYLVAGDLGVIPNRSTPAISARYTSPLKAFESMAAGLPLVASDLPSLREVLVDEAHAVFVAPDDAAALADGIERLAGDAELRRSMAERGQARAGELTWDARAERLLRWMEARA